MRTLALALILSLALTGGIAPDSVPKPVEVPKPPVVQKKAPGGVQGRVKVSRGKTDTRRYIGSFEVTSYNLTENPTTSGDKTRIGIVAVDPRVIPLGTRLYIEGYGPGLASDTGSAIVGRKLDVWLPGDKAWDWGRRRKIRVWVVE